MKLIRLLLPLIFGVVTVPAADRPNILFAISDDQSFPHASAYGTEWVDTPAFDRVAREGLLFMRAYTPNAKCAPSRSCIVTGRNSWQLKEAANHWPFFPAEFKSYAEALGENGYIVGKTGKAWGPGVSNDADGNRRHLVGPGYDKRTSPPPAKFISGNDYASNFGDFLEAAGDQPWCFWYGATEPHRRYEYGAGAAKAGKKTADIDRVPGIWPDNETVRNDLLDYAFEIEHFDRHLGRMLAMLEENGELENTLVVVTSDNGMPFPRVKGQEYEMSNHLPLAIMWPAGIENPGRVIEDYVSFIDFAPTFIEVAGLTWSETGMAPSPGRSLTDIFSSELNGLVNPARDHVLIGKERHDIGRPDDQGYPIRGLVKDGYLYLVNFHPERWPAGNPETGYLNTDGSPTKTEILNARRLNGQNIHWSLSFGKNGQEELYDVRNDFDCVINLANRPDFQPLRASLVRQMVAGLMEQGDPRMSEEDPGFDAFPYSDTKMRDFHNRFVKGEELKAGWVNETDFEKEEIDVQ